MAVPSRYILHQAPVIAALGQSALTAMMRRLRGGASTPELPGPELLRKLPARAPDLVRHYVRQVGGDPGSYKRTLPPHLFPQWGFPLATQVLSQLAYPFHKVLNAGCSMTINEQLPQKESLLVRARLESIDDNGRRAIIKTRIVTGTKSCPDALVGMMTVLVPLGGKRDPGAPKPKKKERPSVPKDARELMFWKLNSTAGLEFAKLTGDFNPLHWVPAYARASGFRNCILHGFATMAYAIEGLHRNHLSGDVNAIRSVDVDFTSPLVLPARVGLYLGQESEPEAPEKRSFFVGDAPAGRAYLRGHFTT
jgi:hypothetical protein